jgi:phosphoribosylaminoimidazole carboxylase PurE protein
LSSDSRFSDVHEKLPLAIRPLSSYILALTIEIILSIKEKNTMPNNSAPVAVVMGSDSDYETMRSCIDTLGEFGVKSVVRILSAHRTPVEAGEFADGASKSGIKVIIAAAGMAAHLAGAIAGKTTVPVIGVPMNSGALNGFDALLSTVQMPPGVPVATVAIGKAGAKNAAILAVQILALSDGELFEKLCAFKESQRQKVLAKDAELSS